MKNNTKDFPQRQIVCPICNAKFQNWNNAKACITLHKRQLGISTSDMKWKLFFNTFPEFNSKEKFEKLYAEKSIPDFRRDYGCCQNQISKVIDYYGLPHRGISEGRKIGQKNFEKTCLEKYGCKNPSSNEKVKQKKKDTFQKHFGVDNIFKNADFVDYVKTGDWCRKRYGCSQSELKSKNQRSRIEAMTDLEKETFLQNSLWKNKFNANSNKINGVCGSKLEAKVADLLTAGGVDYETQYKLNFKEENGKTGWKFYDFLIKDLNILIEVNGDYWHANPFLYKPLDEIEYFSGKCLAKNIWEKDILKERIAYSKNYIIICIWETELKTIDSFENLNCLIQQKLKEVQKYGTTYKQEKDKLQQ